MPTVNQLKTQQKAAQKPAQSEETPEVEAADQMFHAVHEATEKMKSALVAEQTAVLQGFVASLEHAEERRDEMVDILSDRLMRLHHSGFFIHDVLLLTQRKLQASYAQTPLQSQATTTAIDSLVQVFDAVAKVEESSRFIASHSLLGSLPL
jgi:hypothetical protein